MTKFLDKPIKGAIIIAEPLIEDPNFERSVILLTEHNDDGTVGFILNRPLELTLGDLVEDLSGISSKVYEGGPVQKDEMYIIHQCGKDIAGSVPITSSLWWGGDFNEIQEKITSGVLAAENFKLFLGYSGWSFGQLNQEVRDRSWVILDSKKFQIFNRESGELWKEVMKELGGEYPLWSNSPSNPILN